MATGPTRKAGGLQEAAAAQMVVEVWPIDRPVPFAANPRQNDSAVPKVAASLREFGWRQPIVVDESGVVIAGHTRLLAARSLGMTEVPVHVATGLTDAQVRAYRLADNRTAQEAEWDDALLTGELLQLDAADFDLAVTGFDADELDALLAGPGGNGPDGDSQLGDVTYQVVVTCRSEQHQAQLCERLEQEGLQCRLLTL